jgi:hypothetical protein
MGGARREFYSGTPSTATTNRDLRYSRALAKPHDHTEPRVRPDWRRLKAVVLESDDWGLCAWVPDDAAHRALVSQPAFRSAAGQRYGRSTLESADDVHALVARLLTHRGADGLPPVWQANTIVAAPDWVRLTPGASATREPLPIVAHEALPPRWQRPGLTESWREAIQRGVWWPELHGLHHLPEVAWQRALRDADAEACAALGEQSPICTAVEASGEYDDSEPREVRARILREAIARFTSLFGRAPGSFCPPDYRFDPWLEDEAASLGLTTLQGKAERDASPAERLRRRLVGNGFPELANGRFVMPPRISFEPRGSANPRGKVGADAAHRAARAAWWGGEPAVISSHRLNYAHIDASWSEAGRAALDDLLSRLCADGATFLVDADVRSLLERGELDRPRTAPSSPVPPQPKPG